MSRILIQKEKKTPLTTQSCYFMLAAFPGDKIPYKRSLFTSSFVFDSKSIQSPF